jgi:hypothetical protein
MTAATLEAAAMVGALPLYSPQLPPASGLPAGRSSKSESGLALEVWQRQRSWLHLRRPRGGRTPTRRRRKDGQLLLLVDSLFRQTFTPAPWGMGWDRSGCRRCHRQARPHRRKAGQALQAGWSMWGCRRCHRRRQRLRLGLPLGRDRRRWRRGTVSEGPGGDPADPPFCAFGCCISGIYIDKMMLVVAGFRPVATRSVAIQPRI